MNPNICDDSQNVTSFEEHYTDFDNWLIRFRRYQKRSIEARQGDSSNAENLTPPSWQHLLVYGLQIERKLRKKSDVKTIFSCNDNLSFDHVIFELINTRNNILHQYTKSKLVLTRVFINMKKREREWNVKTRWGKIAMVSWGNPAKPPILLVHGFMDSAATFIPLVDQLSDDYYYVGFDMPGHGKSEPFPPGIIISQIHIVEIIRRVVEHMKWKQFVFMAHSMGCLIGLFYHHVFPGKIKKMLLLDPLLPLSFYYYVHYKLPFGYHYSYRDYYDNFQKWSSGKPRLYTYDNAISLIVRNRNLTEEQADIVLSRSLIPMGIDTYKFSWEPRMKKITAIPISEEILYALMTTNMPPTLSIEASEVKGEIRPKKFAENLLQKCDETLPHFHRITVTGSHDVHITHPELLVAPIESLLKTAFEKRNSSKKCKL